MLEDLYNQEQLLGIHIPVHQTMAQQNLLDQPHIEHLIHLQMGSNLTQMHQYKPQQLIYRKYQIHMK